MKIRQQKVTDKDRMGERGAALVTVLMVSFLLIVAITALLFEASMNTGNVTDATAEQQAYYAAESGIQSVIHVLRHSPAPDPLIDPSKTPYPPDPNAHPANKIDYFKAVRRWISNKTNPTDGECSVADPPLDCTARLSRWLNYGNNAAFPDRVVLGDPGVYTERNGFAFRVTVEDPDNVTGVVGFNAQSIFEGNSAPSWTSPPDAAGNQLTVEYRHNSPYVVDVSTGIGPSTFGTFVISGSGPTFETDGAKITNPVRFFIYFLVNQPYATTVVYRGYIEAGTVKPGNIGTVRLFFDTRDTVVFGSVFSLTGGTLVEEQKGDPGAPSGPYGVYRTGYEIVPNPPMSGIMPGSITPGETLISGTVTAPEPLRIVVRSTGFGPNGAVKELESVIQKNYFNGLGAPSPLTLIGPPCTPVGLCVPTGLAPSFIFQPGTSTGTIYSGKDVRLKAFLPPIGLTNDPNMIQVRERLTAPPPNKYNGSVFGNVSNIAVELPQWLRSPKNLDATLERLKDVARASGKYYGPTDTPPNSGGGRYGDYLTATGITFIDGDLEFSQDGGGILVVTGGLTFKGGFRFNGLIVVTGAAGISRTGGGSGSLQGNMIVAPYTKIGIGNGLTCSDNPFVFNKLDCFLAPRYDISGGGSSEIIYNSNNVTNGLGALTNFAKGVAEK
jgi:hypothetical protein